MKALVELYATPKRLKTSPTSCLPMFLVRKEWEHFPEMHNEFILN